MLVEIIYRENEEDVEPKVEKFECDDFVMSAIKGCDKHVYTTRVSVKDDHHLLDLLLQILRCWHESNH